MRFSTIYKFNLLVIAPLSLATLFLMILTGYAQVDPDLVSRLTLGLINYTNAFTIHVNTHPILWLLVVTHALINIRMRWRKYLGMYTDLVLIIIWIILIVPVLWLRLSLNY